MPSHLLKKAFIKLIAPKINHLLFPERLRNQRELQ